jgi:AcrR family transcriptional regulator
MNERSGLYRLRFRCVNLHNERAFMTDPLRSDSVSLPPTATSDHALGMRERILAGAKRAFLVSGFRGTSVPAIAAEAGVSVGQIYRYFPSKEEVFLSVCQGSTEAQMDELATALAQIDDPRERLRAAVSLFVRSLVEEDWGAIVIHALAEADRNPRLRDMLQRLWDQDRGFAAMFVREAIARGEAPSDLDVEAISQAAAMLLHGAIVHRAERGTAFDPELAERAMITLLSANLGS